MFFPIIVPKTEEPKCPKCGREEDTIEVCRNCGYEYPDEYYTFCDHLFDALKALLFILGFLWISVTFLQWLVISDEHRLIPVICSQLEWIKEIRFF